jgi:uncharacterized protein
MNIDGDHFILRSCDIQELVYGASFLGSGGGGDPYIGRLILQQEMDAHKELQIVDPSAVHDDAHIIGIGAVGAPSVLIERLPNIDSFLHALDHVKHRTGKKIDAIVPIEAGGLNATLPLAVALRAGLPVIDADGMGRAFPETQMMTFSIYGYVASPLYLVDDFGHCATVETNDNAKTDRWIRPLLVAMGGAAMAAAYPLSGKMLKAAAVRNTISTQLGIGRAVFAAKRKKRNPVKALVRHFRECDDGPRFAAKLFAGKVIDVNLKIEGAFNVGHIRISNTQGRKDICVITVKNENLIAKRRGHVLALVPDIITVIDAETAEPITTENIKYGQRVEVVTLAAPDVLRSKKALGVLGPRAFGLKHDYTPVEELCADN